MRGKGMLSLSFERHRFNLRTRKLATGYAKVGSPRRTGGERRATYIEVCP